MLITPHEQRERGKVIGLGVHILEIDSPFQILTVGLLVKFID